MEKQLIELQEMFAHQQMTLHKMSDEMFAQQKEIAALKHEVKRLREQMQQVSAQDESGGSPEPPPPHY